MKQKIRTYINWSSGKDASLALYKLKKDNRLHIDRLVTSVNTHYERVSMHGLRVELLEKQAHALELPLEIIRLPEEPSMEDYNKVMEHTIRKLRSEGVYELRFWGYFPGGPSSV